MHDFSVFRVDAGGDPDVVRESQRRRGADVGLVNAVIALDERWRAQLAIIQSTHQAARADLEEAAGAAKAAATSGAAADADEAFARAARERRRLAERLEPLEQAERAFRAELHAAAARVGTLVHEHAPLRPELLEGEGGGAGGRGSGEPGGGADPAEAPWRALVELGWAELHRQGATAWRARGEGMLAQHAMICHALAAAALAGYTLIPWPAEMCNATRQRLNRLRSERGEDLSAPLVGGPRGDPAAGAPAYDRHAQVLASMHASSWLLEKDLPHRYAYVVTDNGLDGALDGACGPHVCVSEVWPDDGSCWAALEAVASLSEALHLSLGVAGQRREEHTGALGHSEARAVALEFGDGAARAAGGCPITLSRAACHESYVARSLGMRCGSKKLGERQKRFVHTVSATICTPARYLLALAAASAKPTLPDALLAGLGGSGGGSASA